MSSVSKLIFGAAIATVSIASPALAANKGEPILLITTDTSHEAPKDAASTISSRRHRVRGCRIVIQILESVTQMANRAAIKRISDYKAHGLFLDRPRRREAT